MWKEMGCHMPADTQSLDSGNAEENLEFLLVQYQVLSERRNNYNTLLWNVPSLLFVAQTFLWTLALDSGKNPVICCGVSILSVMVAYASYQLFERHRLVEVVDSEHMHSIEEYIRQNQKAGPVPAMIVHHKLDMQTLIRTDGGYGTVSDFLSSHEYYKNHNKKTSLCRQVSFTLWRVIFVLTLVLSCAVFIYNVMRAFGVPFFSE